MAGKGLAIANNDTVLLFWRYDEKIANCLGFSIHRQAAVGGSWIPLPAWVGFEGENNAAWKARDTDVWPVQKFSWKDLTAERGGSYRYRVVPMRGHAGSLQPDLQSAIDIDEVTLTPKRGVFRTYFNRGILSTQFLVHQLPTPSGGPSQTSLAEHGQQPGDPLREALAGDIITGLLSLLDRAKVEGGRCYAALYELADKELFGALLKSKDLHLILSNTGAADEENHEGRVTLHAAPNVTIIDRFITSGIGHNKFVVYEDASGAPKAVLLGSTNWTWTALVGQSNNALVVESPELAKQYLEYWNALKADTTSDGHGPQAAPLRTADAHPKPYLKIDPELPEAAARVWFSPNTPTKRPRDHAHDATPPDLKEVFDLIENAKEAVLFLEFQPGEPSVVTKIAEVSKARPELFVRGAVTDPRAAEDYRTVLFHRPGADPDAVIPASAIDEQFASWQKELLKSSRGAHAIIHNKIVVIDPMSKDCVVVTGSHNHGYAASYNNDENLLIVKGHPGLAHAYAAHVMDIYDHYRFRFALQEKGHAAFSGLKRDPTWQDRYFDGGLLAADSKPWGLGAALAPAPAGG